jgi:hypothetical protein
MNSDNRNRPNGVQTSEHRRLEEASAGIRPWKKWGPYLSERQWGTVREDFSESGDAWNDFSHDQARSRTYRWGEDGLAGISDDRQTLCFSLALWNGQDSILKERLFGLTNGEGNHGEDVKEYYFYLDSTPTHSYMKYLYKYPQSAFPYLDLVETNRKRTREDLEYELIDTGIFDEDRYFDVFVEYAKSAPEDILIRITAANRGPDAGILHLLPTVWFRNTWSWQAGGEKPVLKHTPPHDVLDRKRRTAEFDTIQAAHPELGDRFLYCEPATLLFTENETNTERLFGVPNQIPYVKDAFHRYLIQAETDAVNPAMEGTKAALHYPVEVPSGEEMILRLRLSDQRPQELTDPIGAEFDAIFASRVKEADAFYDAVISPNIKDSGRQVMRQAFAGMLWTKQTYYYDVTGWLKERGADPYSADRRPVPRNDHWFHMVNEDVISMPDKWEYPWYAAWDLAFHVLPLSMIDPDFAREQLDLMLREHYLHPNGQIPAYEWNFSDVNPPVHAWATVFNHELSLVRHGQADVGFLKHAFQKLLLNFTWWVNRKDRFGKNVFEGGFLGLDNIGVFDRSSALPTGGHLEQADGTAWMAIYSQDMLQMAVYLARHDQVYEDMALKFFEHFLWIASAMNRSGEGHGRMWDEEDGFFYDVLRFPDGEATRLKVRSMVGLLPLCAAATFEPSTLERLKRLAERTRRFVEKRPEVLADITDLRVPGYGGRSLLSLLDEEKLRRVLSRMLDEDEFLSSYGIRSLSRYHLTHPYVFHVGGQEYRVEYLPAESNTGMFGGNSNWRGPIWFPVNTLIISALLQFYLYYGNEFKVACPTGSDRMMTLYEVAEEITRRLSSIFLRDEEGRRPVHGGTQKFQEDPHWRNLILFYEYFHGDNGAGLGASHQTGWTGVVATLMDLFASLNADQLLVGGIMGDPE